MLSLGPGTVIQCDESAFVGRFYEGRVGEAVQLSVECSRHALLGGAPASSIPAAQPQCIVCSLPLLPLLSPDNHTF